ncbi:unnamed protein product [Rhizophagus irregularis]|uniref:Galactose oxidase n=1 Tax=Rhizophagus irregularis TaxID=588596 RepID=A0A2N1NNC0_9GLOM|nr:galactose oxidase [Rhizophagus irregularis]CAB4382461.1 unnamed protein product [Rhizophagus irregularis]CAB5377232.1 unnamed protein product [Rhizophagus irregularis]
MNINNLIKIFFLLIILSIEIGQSLIPLDRYSTSSILIDKKLFFFGGETVHNLKPSTTLDQILYLDVSKPFNTVNPPFEELPNTIPFGSSYAIAFPSSQKNVIYLFGGITVNVNTDLDDFKSILHSYNLETNEWTIPTTSGIAPGRRREISGVINNNTGKFYAFGGLSDQFTGTPNNTIALNDMNIFDINTLAWSKGSTINAPLPRADYTATLLSNGIIVYIGGRETNAFRDVDINQLALYDTKVDKWSLMTARGVTMENRFLHSAVLTPDERIIIFGGRKVPNDDPVLNQLAVLNTKMTPYEWSIPQVPAIDNMPLTTSAHSATLVGNYMFINFGQITPITNPQIQLPFFYILDIRNFTWIIQFEPEKSTIDTTSVNKSPSNSTSNSPDLPVEKSDNGKQIGIILGTVGLSIGIGIVVGFLGYKYYKKQKYKHAIPTAGSPTI